MKYLFDQWKQLSVSIKSHFVLLLLDYDGTLTPIVESPDKAVLSKHARDLLERLSKCPACKVAIISGRALTDVKKLVAVKNLVYIGNHGLEIEGPGIKFESLVSLNIKSVIERIERELYEQLKFIPGVLVEDKGLTLSIHYRKAESEKEESLIKKITQRAVKPYIAKKEIRVGQGKKVIEIRPPIEWDKGKAALWLLGREQFALGKNKVFPVCLGDDLTDEDAFMALKTKGLAVLVGKPKPSYAQYYLNDSEDVLKFLGMVLQAKQRD